jgi:hypothetical protein
MNNNTLTSSLNAAALKAYDNHLPSGLLEVALMLFCLLAQGMHIYI